MSLTGNTWVAYTYFHRLLQLDRCEKEDPALVARINSLLSSRTGRFKMYFTHAVRGGITLYCVDPVQVPKLFRHSSRTIHVIDRNGFVRRTIKPSVGTTC